MTVGAVNIALGALTADYEAGMRRASSTTSQAMRDINARLAATNAAGNRLNREFQRGFGATGEAMQRFGRTMMVAVTLPLSILAATSLKSYQEMSKLEAGIVSVERSAFVAKGTISKLVEVAKLPGIGIAEANQMYLGLRNVNVQGETAIRTMKALGNAVASGGGGKEQLGSLATQIPQLIAKNKVTAEDLKPIINASPAVASALMKLYGTVSSEDIQNKLKAAGKGAREFMADLVSELEKMPKVANSFNNAIESFEDSLKIVGGNFGKAADEAFGFTEGISNLGTSLVSVSQAFSDADTDTKKFIMTTVAMVAAFPVMITGIGSVISLFGGPWNAGMKAASASLKGVFNLLNANPWIVVAGGIALATKAIYEHFEAQDKLLNKQRIINDIKEDAIPMYASEVAQVSALTEVIKNNNYQESERHLALGKLVEMSKEYYGKLSIEKLNIDALNEATKKYTEEIINNALAKAGQSKIEGLAKSLFEMKEEFKVAGGAAYLQQIEGSKGQSSKIGKLTATAPQGGIQTFLEIPAHLKEKYSQIQKVQQNIIDISKEFTIKGSNILSAAGFGSSGATSATGGGTTDKAVKELQKLAEKGRELTEKTYADAEKLSIENIADERERKAALLAWEFEQDVAAKTREYEELKKPKDEAYWEWLKVGTAKTLSELERLQIGTPNLIEKITPQQMSKGFQLGAALADPTGSRMNRLNPSKVFNPGAFTETIHYASTEIEKVNQAITASFEGMKEQSILSIGAVVGEMIAGTATMKDLANNMLGSVSGLLQGVAMSLFKINPILGIVAAISGGLLGSFAKRTQSGSSPRTSYANYTASGGGFIPKVQLYGESRTYGSTMVHVYDSGQKELRARI